MTRIGVALAAAGIILCLASPGQAQDPPDGKRLFTLQCAVCHSVEPGKNGAGPSLAKIMGRHAGSLKGFNYSPALKSSGIVWNEQTLEAWLTNPPKDVPGTRMYFPGLADAAKRQAIIDYLKSL